MTFKYTLLKQIIGRKTCSLVKYHIEIIYQEKITVTFLSQHYCRLFIKKQFSRTLQIGFCTL